MKLHHLLSAAFLALSTLSTHAINVTEPPDQANTGLGTAYVLEKGTNTISGTVSTPSDGQDRFQVSVPEGMFLVEVSKTTSGGSFDGGFVSFNNQSLNGIGGGSYSGMPLGFGTYPVLISSNLTVGTNWSLTFTVENPGVVIGVDTFDYPDGPLAGQAGGTFWDYKNVSPTGRTGVKSNWENLTGSPAISGGRLHTGGSSLVKRKYNGNTETNGAVNDANVAKAVFYRVTCTTGATLPDFFGFASYDFGAQRLFLGKRSGGSTFGYEIAGGASASSAFAPPVNSTFTLVMRLDFATMASASSSIPTCDSPSTIRPMSSPALWSPMPSTTAPTGAPPWA